MINAFVAAHAETTLHLGSRCREREHIPFNAIDPLIDTLAQALDKRFAAAPFEHVEFAPLLALFPGLESKRRRPGSKAASGQTGARHRAFTTLAQVFAVAATLTPVVLVIDDAQWADADSLAMLEALLHPPGAALLLIMAVREPGQVELTAPPDCHTQTISLGPLPTRCAAELARHLLGSTGTAIESLVRESGGHPMFVRELARMPANGEVAVSGKLSDVLAARIDRLEADTRQVLELVALAAIPLARAVIALAFTGATGEAAQAIDRLVYERLVRATGTHGAEAFEPYHDRLRQLLNNSLDAPRARLHHRQIATAIETVQCEQLFALTHHFRGAGIPKRARRYARAAGERALSQLAFEQAAELFATVRELGADDSELWLQTARAHEGAGRGAKAAQAYCNAAARIDNDPHQVNDLHRRAAEQLLRAGELDAGVDAIAELLEGQGLHFPRSPGRALWTLVVERVRLQLTSQAPPGKIDTDQERQLNACWALAVGLSQVDPVRGALFQTKHLRFALRTGDPTRIALGLCAEALSAAAAGPPARRANSLLERAQQLSTQTSDPRVNAYLQLARAQVAFLCADYRLARKHAQLAAQLFGKLVGAWWEVATAREFHLSCLWHTGRITELATSVDSAYEQARQQGDRYALTQLQTTVVPPLCLLRDDPYAAERALDEAWASWSHREMWLQHWQHLQATALVHLYRGEPALAVETFSTRWKGAGKLLLSRVKAVRSFTAFVRGTAAVGALAKTPNDRKMRRVARRDIAELRGLPVVTDVHAMLQGQLAYVDGDLATAAHSLETARSPLREREAPHLLACVDSALATIYADQGDTQASRDAVTRALAYFLEQPIARPDKVAAMLIPGIGHAALAEGCSTRTQSASSDTLPIAPSTPVQGPQQPVDKVGAVDREGFFAPG